MSDIISTNILNHDPRNVDAFGGMTEAHRRYFDMSILSPKKSGVYAISNKINGKRYIGSSADIRGRWFIHLSRLRSNKHHSRHLQNAWNKYGEDSFILTVIETCSKDNILEREQFYIDTMRPEYNISPTASSTRGIVRTKETREKLSAYHSNRPKDVLEKMSVAAKKRDKSTFNTDGLCKDGFIWIGRKHTDTSKSKMSAAKKGRQTKKHEDGGLYKGVAFHSFSGLWRAYIYVNRKQRSLGYYKTALEAAKAYDSEAKKIFGKNAVLNFE